MRDVMTEPRYTDAARSLSAEIGRAGGAETAADLIEQVLRTGRLLPDVATEAAPVRGPSR